MGKQSPTDKDLALSVVTGSSTATGASEARVFTGTFNVTLRVPGTQTFQLQRSFDGGTNWDTVSKDADGNAASYTVSCSFTLFEPEEGVLWRVNCSAYTSGTGVYRISQ